MANSENIRKKPLPADYGSINIYLAQSLHYGLRNFGYNGTWRDVLDPSGILPVNVAVTNLPPDLRVGQTFYHTTNQAHYKLVQAASSLVAVTDPEVWGFDSTGKATNDQSVAISLAGMTSGFSPAANGYFWLQTSGTVAGVLTNGSVLIGNALKWLSDTQVAPASAATDPVNAAAATAEDGGNLITVMLTTGAI